MSEQLCADITVPGIPQGHAGTTQQVRDAPAVARGGRLGGFESHRLSRVSGRPCDAIAACALGVVAGEVRADGNALGPSVER